MPNVFPDGVGGNRTIFFSDRGARAPFSILASDRVAELHLCASTDGFQSVPIYAFKDDKRTDNITDWAFDQFRAHYASQAKPSQAKPSQAKPSQAKPKVIDLLRRVTCVSVETMKIVEAMKAEKR
jgi:predicted helicase